MKQLNMQTNLKAQNTIILDSRILSLICGNDIDAMLPIASLLNPFYTFVFFSYTKCK